MLISPQKGRCVLKPTYGLLAVLGRGVQKLHEEGPWVLTEDLEMWSEESQHLAVRVPADDLNPFCMVGGGELNPLAGVELFRRHGAEAVVCAYGDRTKYLKEIDGPSESMVMGEKFQEMCPDAHLKTWTKDMSRPGPSNTNAELYNIFQLATMLELFRGKSHRIGIVTIDLHMPRTLVMAQRHLASTFTDLAPVDFFVSEQVLVEADQAQYSLRREALRDSAAFKRNWEQEKIGIFKTLTNAYGDEKPTLVTNTANS
jgi:hypothetical protein